MSASSKKKLRKEQNAAVMTEKQQKAQKEAKKLKLQSTIFIIVMVAVILTAVFVMAIRGFQSSGIMEKKTIAATVGDTELNSVQMSYYYADAVNATYSQWNATYGDAASSYLMMMGLDATLPLDEQSYMGEEMTWADYFMETALDQAKADHALYNKAMEEGFALSEGDQSALDSSINNVEMYAMIYGYTDVDSYLVANYGHGADRKSYEEYVEISTIASAYYTAHQDSLVYDDAALRAYEADKFENYSSFDYVNYYVNCSNFLPEDAKENPTDAQLAEAEAAAKDAAESLLSATTVEELDAAIAALEIPGAKTESTKIDKALYVGLSSSFNEWLADESRVANDIAVLPYETTSTDEAGNETTKINGYYVVMFLGRDDNTEPMGNVRHLLVKFEGGTTDELGNTVYSDAEKAAAKAEADGYLKTWQDGEATEESFIELIKEHSDDTTASTGGLFEDLNPDSSYVENFLSWSIDPNRQTGDAEVVETEYGYHVMYYVGDDELSYRDHMITNDMLYEDMENWYNAIVDPVTATLMDTSKMNVGLILSPETAEEEGHEGHNH